jgi:hypothetical protein
LSFYKIWFLAVAYKNWFLDKSWVRMFRDLFLKIGCVWRLISKNYMTIYVINFKL